MDHAEKGLVARSLLMRDLIVRGTTERNLIVKGDAERSPNMMGLVTATMTRRWKI
jgi:hypothetical protein